MAIRPSKTFRLAYVKTDPKLGAVIQILGNPAEVRIAASDKSFISVRDDGISVSPGLANNLNLQVLPHNMRYAGLLMDLPFPLSILPTTPFTPFPKQIFAPPLAKILPAVSDISLILSSLVV